MQTTQNAAAIEQPAHLEPIAVTPKEAARISGLSYRSIWRLIEKGRLTISKPPHGRTVVLYASLKALLVPPVVN